MKDDTSYLKAVGRRLAQARVKAGYPTQKSLAEALGLAVPTIAKYEQGTREVPLPLLAWLSENHGADTHWIITGRSSEPPFTPMEMVQTDHLNMLGSSADLDLFLTIGDMVRTVHEELGVPLAGRGLANASREVFRSIKETLDGEAGPEELNAVLQLENARLRRKLAEARLAPGTGKRSA